jgi:hypothetical protein
MDIITHYFSSKLAAVQAPNKPDTRNSKRRVVSPSTPDLQDEPYPFEMPGAIDKFELAPAMPDVTSHGLEDIINDEITFSTCLASLSNNKAPGPDGVTNEILKALSTVGKQAIHNMFKLMWQARRTPAQWKQSNTILLYKNKGTITNLKYYRQIGLEDTIYKLWTRMVTIALSDFGERHGIHSNTQADFRAKRTTSQQIEAMIMAMEDARQHKQTFGVKS